jgi:hypothetical protein
LYKSQPLQCSAALLSALRFSRAGKKSAAEMVKGIGQLVFRRSRSFFPSGSGPVTLGKTCANGSRCGYSDGSVSIANWLEIARESLLI